MNARIAAVVLLACSLSTAAHAEFDGTVENLSEGYMLFQAIEACNLAPSPAAVEILQTAIRTFEARASEADKKALWAEAAEDMPSIQLLGVCPVIGAEIDMLEAVGQMNTPGQVPAKPNF